MTDRKKLGNQGETLARKYLEKSGYEIITANFRYGRNEIDLIARRKGIVVFFEIKTNIKRKNKEENNGADCLSAAQTNRLKRVINFYCLKNRLSGEKVRLDLIVISVDSKNNRADLDHYRDIF